MVNKNNQSDDDLEVLVDVPPTDGEIFANIFSFGKIKIRRPIKMTMREYKDYKSFNNLCLAGIIILGSIGLYEDAQKYGSIGKFFQYHINQLEKLPSAGIYP